MSYRRLDKGEIIQAGEATPDALTEAALKLEGCGAEPEIVGLMLACSEQWRLVDPHFYAIHALHRACIQDMTKKSLGGT